MVDFITIIEYFAGRKGLMRDLAAKFQWHFGRCPSCDSSEDQGHTKHCELARLLENRTYRSLGNLRGRPTTLPGVWGKLARAEGGVAQLAEALEVSPRTLNQWAYLERRPSWLHIVILREMLRTHGLAEPTFKAP
jgi:hypothetical protein